MKISLKKWKQLLIVGVNIRCDAKKKYQNLDENFN